MENAKKSTLAFLLPYAIGLLIIRLIIDTIIKQFELGYNGESYGSYISFIIEAALIFVTINNYKKFQSNNKLHFAEGVKIGVALMLIVGVFFSIYLVVHGKYIDPDYQQRLTEEAIKKLNNPQVTTETLKRGESGSIIGLFMSILKYIFIGALGGIISSAILKTEQ